jgi:glycosyltransferase involved in cell wall biosynthesis
MVVWLERFAASFLDKIHALTELEKRDLVKFGICKEEKIEVISSGLELDFFRKDEVLKKDQRKPLCVAMAGRLEPVKRPQDFVEAAVLVLQKNKDLRFLVVGDGSLMPVLRKRVQELNLQGYIAFLGWREDIISILSEVDIFVLPSLNEAVGRSALEAQALGVPVVATKVGGIPEIVQDGRTGILINPKDPQRLAEAIIFLSENEEKREQMSEAAKKWVDEKFSDRLMVEKFAKLYKQMNGANVS